MKWFNDIITSKSGVSSKRVAGLFVVLNATILTYLSVLGNDIDLVDVSLIESLYILGGSLLGLGLLDDRSISLGKDK